MANDKQESNRSGASGLVFVGCVMLGLALGFILKDMVIGIFVGLGFGFIGMAIARYVTGAW